MVGPEWWIHTLRAIRHLNAYYFSTWLGSRAAKALAEQHDNLQVYPGGGKYFKNPYSADANKTYTLILAGTDGGLRTGALQPAPTPAFDHHGNSLAGRIIRPTDFAGINFGLATKGTAPVISVSGGRLSGQVKGFTAEWNNLSFSQEGPVAGSYNSQTHVYVLTWSSLISGGPFNGFTGSWHLTGTFVS